MLEPFNLLIKWIAEEKQTGVPNPQQAILSTVGVDGIPHARVVAIREITDEALIFFTQKCTRKVSEMQHNPNICLTFWFEYHQREIIIEGKASALTASENEQYWQSYPKAAQIRFCTYAPTSSQPIGAKETLEKKRVEIQNHFTEKTLPMSEDYCGYVILPQRFIFYHYRLDELSDVIEYRRQASSYWHRQLLSP